MKLLIRVLLVVCVFSLTGCSIFGNSYKPLPPTKLVKFKPTVNLAHKWSNGRSTGTSQQYLRLTPALDNAMVFTASYDGVVNAARAYDGRNVWRQKTNVILSSGVAAGNNKIYIGSGNGRVYALNQKDGSLAWSKPLNSEVLATPVVAGNILLVKTEIGSLIAYNAINGKRLWSYQNIEPGLILRGSSSPVVHGRYVVAGFANGKLAVLTLRSGQVVWQRTIAEGKGSTSVQRMVDIDATPSVINNTIYVATYQGKIAAVSLRSGRIRWQHKLSSYTGLVADKTDVYVTDAKGCVWAFDRHTGEVVWKLSALLHRGVTAPAEVDNYIVVADALGYLHVITKDDGQFAARTKVGWGGISARPVTDNHSIYAYTNYGKLAKYFLYN
ncbi:MAG: outer membrane protein assembly factor BamB [Gammaproteobacteria bacterium]|nr:outer membrane protein assembly factor BamB [Gammaproteobacteria bacterium]